MGSFTSFYSLQKLSQGDAFSLNGYKYTESDRETIDRLLHRGAESHRHTGLSADGVNPSNPPIGVMGSEGSIPAETLVSYKYSLVNERGEESLPSPELNLVTPNPIFTPGLPILNLVTGGTLLPGNYFYKLSAYVDYSTSETLTSSSATTVVPITGSSRSVNLSFPTLPDGATGFNVYRRKPGQSRFFFVTSIDLNVATPPTSFLDDGSISEDCDRGEPNLNTTNSNNSVEIELPQTPPAGWTWRLYRTYIPNVYTRSLLSHVVEWENELEGEVVTTFIDTGLATSPGQPQFVSQIIGSPPKIDLTDALEVTGSLPLKNTVYPFVEEFLFAGVLSGPLNGETKWVNIFPKATIVGIKGVVGYGETVDPIEFSVDRWDSQHATPQYVDLFDTEPNPVIPSFSSEGEFFVPVDNVLNKGDHLRVNVESVGESAGAVHNVSLIFYMIVHGFEEQNSFDGDLGDDL